MMNYFSKNFTDGVLSIDSMNATPNGLYCVRMITKTGKRIHSLLTKEQLMATNICVFDDSFLLPVNYVDGEWYALFSNDTVRVHENFVKNRVIFGDKQRRPYTLIKCADGIMVLGEALDERNVRVALIKPDGSVKLLTVDMKVLDYDEVAVFNESIVCGVDYIGADTINVYCGSTILMDYNTFQKRNITYFLGALNLNVGVSSTDLKVASHWDNQVKLILGGKIVALIDCYELDNKSIHTYLSELNSPLLINEIYTFNRLYGSKFIRQDGDDVYLPIKTHKDYIEYMVLSVTRPFIKPRYVIYDNSDKTFKEKDMVKKEVLSEKFEQFLREHPDILIEYERWCNRNTESVASW